MEACLCWQKLAQVVRSGHKLSEIVAFAVHNNHASIAVMDLAGPNREQQHIVYENQRLTANTTQDEISFKNSIK